MKKFILSILGIFIILSIGFAAFYYIELELPVESVGKNVEKMISSKNYKQMRQVSDDKKTYQMLKSLPSNTKDTETTDFQGGTEKLAYYVTNVRYKGKRVSFGIEMKQVATFEWQIYSMKKV